MKKVHCIPLIRQTNILMSLAFLMLLIVFVYTTGCSSTPSPKKEKVMVPPIVDLREFGTVGVIEFASNAEGNVPQYVTQQFMQTVQTAQPGVRLLELGREAQVLKAVGHAQLNFEAIRAIGQKYKVDALIYGNFMVSDIKPKVQFSSVYTAMRAQAYVEGKLNNKVWETASGATVWTHLASGREPVAKLSLMKNGPISVGVTDPKEKYGKLVAGLVAVNTNDFWPSYVYRTASK